jgi:UDP-N-acetyl-2-amino-2-deoxyglucuronate dehydrogenase
MSSPILNFGLIGASGYIAPRHMKAIKETGNRLVAALDPHDSIGIMDSFFPDANFFTEPERFDRHLDKLRRRKENKIDYVSICSPNYLHDAHIRMSLRNSCHAICEKPLVLNPWNLDALSEIERETGKNIYTILQLRLHPAIKALKEKIENGPKDKVYDVKLTYITSRGKWYHVSWKGDIHKSGGVATNIGIHFFDMLSWIFGEVAEVSIDDFSSEFAKGRLKLKRANVNWNLSINADHIPAAALAAGKRTFRSITIEEEELEFSEGFGDLHTESYKEILAGRGFGIADTASSIRIAEQIRRLTSK